MFNNKLFYFGATIALCGGLTSCAVDACSFDSDYKKADPQACMIPANIDTGLTVSNKRISRISGGSLAISDKSNLSADVVLIQAGSSLKLGTLSSEDGMLKKEVSAAELAIFTVGEIKLELQGAKLKRKPFSIRLYSEPSFPAKAEGIDWKAIPTTMDEGASGLDIPVMIGITPQPSIVVLNHTKIANGTIKQTTRLYSATPVLAIMSDNLGISLGEEIDSNSYTGFAQSKSGILFNGFDAGGATSSVSRFDSFMGINITQGKFRYKSHRVTSLLCSDINGKVTGAIVDGALSFFEGQSLDTPIKMNHGDNKNASIATLKFGIGDLDGDQYPDVAIWHKLSNTISVYTRKGDILEWSPELSTKLQAKSASVLGQNFPTAVRLADIDRDGVDDIILADRERLIILPNDGTGDYEESIVIPAIGSGANALGPISAIAIGQLGSNPKSAPSLALVSSQDKKIAVVLNQSTE